MGLLDVDVTECDFYYFGVRTPVGLPVIAALEMGGVQYNANPMDFESWLKMKPNTPTGLLPLMKLRDGSYVIESQAILRAVGCATGAIGTGKDFLISEMLMGLTADLLKKVNFPTMMTVKDWTPEKSAEAKTKDVPLVLAQLAKYEQFLADSGDKFTASGVTVGEIDLFCKLHTLSVTVPEMIIPSLEPFVKRMEAIPALKKILDGQTAWGPLPPYFRPFP